MNCFGKLFVSRGNNFKQRSCARMKHYNTNGMALNKLLRGFNMKHVKSGMWKWRNSECTCKDRCKGHCQTQKGNCILRKIA